MKTPIQRSTRKPLACLTLLMVAWIALLQNAQAVVPPPDGCYPNFTTAEGCDTLNSLTTGSGNTGLGWRSLFLTSTGSFNTGVGGGALALNNADSNTAVGAAALLLNTSGDLNTAVGTDALVFNDTGLENSAVGAFALSNNTEGESNTATGNSALGVNTTGSFNTAMGVLTLSSNSTGNFNTAIGDSALLSATGSGNIAVGFQAGAKVASSNNIIAIGSPADDVDNTCFIGNIRDVQTQHADAIPVLVDSAGQLGTISSSRRFKKEIKAIDKASEAVLALKPVTFHYKSDKARIPQFGLIAEEVAEVNPDLVVRDENGEIYTVRYDAVNAMLLNEFLKDHRKIEEQNNKLERQARKVQEQETTISELKSEMKRLAATVNDQASQVRKVSAQLEINNAGPKMAAE